MRLGFRNILLFTIVSLALLVTGANFVKHQDVLQSLEHQQVRQQEEEQMEKLETSWKDGEHLTHTVITPKKDGEEVPAWVARHKEAVDAMKVAFPPVA